MAEGGLFAFMDLGWEVLDDAHNKTAAYVLEPAMVNKDVPITFFRLTDISGNDEKAVTFSRVLKKEEGVFKVPATRFSLLPNSPMCYYAPQHFIQQCAVSERLSSFAFVGGGAAVHKLFHRNWWELPFDRIGPDRKWVRFTVGGGYSPYYRDNERVILWERDGQAVKEYTLERYPYLGDNPGWRIQNEDRYFRQGLTYGVRTERFNVQLLEPGHIFSDKGQAIFPYDEEDL